MGAHVGPPLLADDPRLDDGDAQRETTTRNRRQQSLQSTHTAGMATVTATATANPSATTTMPTASAAATHRWNRRLRVSGPFERTNPSRTPRARAAGSLIEAGLRSIIDPMWTLRWGRCLPDSRFTPIGPMGGTATSCR